MGTRTRMWWWAATGPSLMLSVALAVVVIGTLPPLVGGLVLLAFPAVALMFATGRAETRAVRLLGRARRLSEGERELVERVTAELVGYGFRVPTLLVARADAYRPAAEGYGRRTVVLAPRFLRWLLTGQVPVGALAAVVAQATSTGVLGRSRFDMTVRWLLLPGRMGVWLVKATVGRFCRAFAPVAWLWRFRGILGVIAVVECVGQHEGVIAAVVGVLVTLSYTVRYSSSVWRVRVQTAADAEVAAAGMGAGLAEAVLMFNEPGAVDRVARIRASGFSDDQAARSQAA